MVVSLVNWLPAVCHAHAITTWDAPPRPYSISMFQRLTSCFLAAALGAAVLAAAPAQTTAFLPVSEIRPGMVGIGHTVFAGDQQEEFKANILGVLRNVIGPGRDL